MERITISEARARLPELAARVAQRSGEVVVIENRRRGERVVLAAEEYVRGLEERVAEMQRSGEAFELEGSMTSALDADALDAALRTLRAQAASEDAGRLARVVE